jgi:hypothetical protein
MGLLGLYPLWWALGIGVFAFVLFAIPMAWHLATHRPVRTIPGFGLWLLFLLWVVVSLLMLPFDAPGTFPGLPSGRILGTAYNLAAYAAATVTLLYVVNLSEQELPERRLVRLLSVLFLVTVAGGILGVVAPRFGFVSPLEAILPASVRSNEFTRALVHPVSAQIQDVFGDTRARPAAPFGYANLWGYHLSILAVWFALDLWRRGSRGARFTGLAVGAVAVLPVVQSLDRALWVGLVLSALYLVVRTALRGDMRASIAVGAGIALMACAVILSPLHDVVHQRLSDPGSAGVRAFLSGAAVTGAEHSPVLGYGGTRKVPGSSRSIAIGPTPHCPGCGQFGVGSNGHFWLVLFSQGFVGAALYVAFFAVTAVRLLQRSRAAASAAALVVLLGLFYMFFYSALPAALCLTMLSIGLGMRAADPAHRLRGRPAG